MASEIEAERKEVGEIQPDPVAVDEKNADSNRSPESDDDETSGLRRVQPTEEEMATLRRVSDHIPWATLSVAFVELCERFSYYGTTAVCSF